MNNGSKVAIGIGAAALLGAAAYFAFGKGLGTAGKFLLQTTSGKGGTVTPNSASGVYYPSGQVVPVIITAASGYTIGQVLEDGNPINTSTTETTATYQITMNMNHEIDVVFYQGGQPPTGAPVALQALNTQTVVWGYYGCQVNLGLANTISNISVTTCDAAWQFATVEFTYITFKAIDANGNGVPGVKIQLWPSLFPDSSKYKGYLILDAQMISQSSPLILTTGSDGTVTVSLSYFCNPSAINQANGLTNDAGLYINLASPVPPFSWKIAGPYNGEGSPGPEYFFTGKGGHGITGQGPAAMGPMQTNTVNAQIIGTSIPTAQTLCSCGFNVKML